MSILQLLLGKPKKAFELEVRFHKEAIFYGEHGTMVVSHRKMQLVEVPVRFVFVGITTPPKLDRILFDFLWEEAKAQGYIPHYISTYGKDNEITSTAKPLSSENPEELKHFDHEVVSA